MDDLPDGMATPTPLWHVPAVGLTSEQFRAVRSICSDLGGLFTCRLTKWSGADEVPLGYVFRSEAAATKAAQAIADLRKAAQAKTPPGGPVQTTLFEASAGDAPKKTKKGRKAKSA